MSNILCFDPSGNFNEGEGTTGWSYFKNRELKDFNTIESKHFSELEKYWYRHYELMDVMTHISFEIDAVVCESFKLDPARAKQQSRSSMETSQLIGYLRMVAWQRGIPFILQDPSIKQRFTDDILVKTGYAEQRPSGLFINGMSTNLHIRDSIRHGLYYFRYGKGKQK